MAERGGSNPYYQQSHSAQDVASYHKGDKVPICAVRTPDSASVQAFDRDIINGKVQEYFSLSAKIGGDVNEQAQLVKDGFMRLRALLVAGSKHKQPTPDQLQKALSPLSTAVSDIQGYADTRRNSKLFNNLMTVKEFVPVVGWVTTPKPAMYIKEIKDQAMFYGNRVLKEHKGKDETHVDWWRCLVSVLTDMEQFVKDYYTIGFTWNPKGSPYTGVSTAAPPPPPPAGGAPPPPPPPAVLPPTAAPTGGNAEGQVQARNELFACLQQGTDITKGLKKVTKDMQTHKNPSLRGGSTVPAGDKPTPATKPSPALSKQTAKKPKCELSGKKWIVEYQSNNPNVVISDTNQSQTVYVYKCDNSTIQIKGKLNSIVLDSCTKTGIVVDDVISTVDFVNCQRVKGQITGKVPCVNIDKVDGIEIYLSKESLNAEFVMAKSSAMNILVPKDDDFVEYALPEQFKGKWNGKSFETTVMESA